MKDDEIERLRQTIAGKNDYVKDLRAEVDAAVSFHTQDQDEIERLKQSLAELQATKAQLMRDHENLAVQRTRLRLSSVERTSARSSGATLIQELSPQLTRPSDEPAQIEATPQLPLPSDDSRNNSIQATPKRHVRSESTPNRWSLMSNDVPPPELRGFRRRSLGLKDLMKKMVKKDPKADAEPEPVSDEKPKSRAALAPRDKNASLRPNTAAPKMVSADPFTDSSVPLPAGMRPAKAKQANVNKNTQRYYATQDSKDKERPQTATGEMKANKDETGRPASRLSWGAT
jgi:hypothetical protein